jgi:hypothetical protein
MPSVALQRRRFANAVYLNNAAIAFMQHGAYLRAVQACKGAICLIQSLVEAGKVNDDVYAIWEHESLDYSGGVNELEQTAVTITAQRLARLSVLNMNQGAAHPHGLHIITFDESLTTDFVQGAASSNGESFYAIRIDASQILTDATVLAEHIHTMAPSTVLSNLALSLCLLGSVSAVRGNSGPTDQKQSGASAMRLLHQALSVMGVYDRTMVVTEGNLFVAIGLYSNLVAMLGRLDETHAVAPTLRVELDMLIQVSLPLLTVTRTFVAMAGAA